MINRNEDLQKKWRLARLQGKTRLDYVKWTQNYNNANDKEEICSKCGYTWNYKGHKKYTNCPLCHKSTKTQWYIKQESTIQNKLQGASMRRYYELMHEGKDPADYPM